MIGRKGFKRAVIDILLKIFGTVYTEGPIA